MIGFAFDLRRRRGLAMLVAALSVLAGPSAHALEAGPLLWHGAAGQAAYGVVELRDAGPLDASAMRVRIAAREAYTVAGLDYHPAIGNVQLSMQALSGGRVQLRLDRLPIDRATLDLLLSLSNRRSMRLVAYRIDLRQGTGSFEPLADGARTASARLPTPHASASASAGAPSALLQPAVAAQDPQALARAALEAWANAWSRRDVDAYVAAYAPGFAGRKNHASREAWIAERRERILSRQSISVSVAAIEARHQDGQIEARFEQRYRSDGPADLGRKRVRLAPIGGRWLIVQEDDLP